MLNGAAPLAAMSQMVIEHLVPELTDSYNAGVLVLLAFIGGFVGLMEKVGVARPLPNPSIPGSNRVFRLSWPPGWAGLPSSFLISVRHSS